jgi:hypothetical protein
MRAASITRASGRRVPFEGLFFGPNGTGFARFHFRAQISLNFQGPPLPMALEMDFPATKSLRLAPYKHRYTNN